MPYVTFPAERKVVRTWSNKAVPYDLISATFVSATPSYVDMGQPATLVFHKNTPFSISVWAKPTTTIDGSLVSKLDSASPYTGYEVLASPFLGAEGDTPGARFQIIDQSGAFMLVDAAVPIFDGQWHLIVATYNGNGHSTGMKIYFDGVLQNGYSQDDGLSDDITNSIPFRLGRRGGGDFGNSLPFNGKMDEVAVWSRALSAADVLDVYNHGRPPDLTLTEDIVGNWRLGDQGDSATRITDRVGTANGTPSGLTGGSFTDDVPGGS